VAGYARIMHPGQRAARELLEATLDAGEGLVLAPQVLAEFVPVVTDGRRFSRPLMVRAAVDRADLWWRSRDVAHAFPRAETARVFVEWMRHHRLGRKRLLDTMLAATYFTCDTRVILTSNARDYRVFGCFDVRTP
jgi:predicted nucleic acid-binding protein